MADEHAHAAPAPFYREENPPRLWVHEDYAAVAPIKSVERFGSVEDWAAYLLRFGEPGSSLVTWNARGFRATLDYAGNIEEQGGSNWSAEYGFIHAPEWLQWMDLCRVAMGQEAAVNCLDNLLDTIIDPPAADLINLLRHLKVTVNATVETDIRADGSTSVHVKEDKTPRGQGDAVIPPEIKIDVPVLVGHYTETGAKATYQVVVKVRPTLGRDDHLTFRFAIPAKERVLELVYADRLERAKSLLDGWELLRAAD